MPVIGSVHNIASYDVHTWECGPILPGIWQLERYQRQRPRLTVLQHFNSVFRIQNRRLAFQKVSASTLHCSVPLCTVSLHHNMAVSFHSSPTDAVVWTEWMQKIWKDNFNQSKNTQVCHRHFQQTDIDCRAPVYLSWNGWSQEEVERLVAMWLIMDYVFVYLGD